VAADDRREEVEVPLVEGRVLDVRAGRVGHHCAGVDHQDALAVLDQLARVGGADRAGAHDQRVHLHGLIGIEAHAGLTFLRPGA
jgi:hypothetical protein